MYTYEKREHQRCNIDTSVLFSFFHQSNTYSAVARNYSHTGMYFETDKKLQPGIIIMIRPLTCGLKSSTEHQPVYCGHGSKKEPACHQLKSMVSGRVTRCQRIGSADPAQYGIAVEYVSPSV